MKLNSVLVRFYRSFNYDFERKWRSTDGAEAWEDVSVGWFPFVRILVDPEITAVIGSNEAGKTQMLNAVEAAIVGSPIDPADFCRYSRFYSAQQGEDRAPEFGAEWRSETEAETDLIQGYIPNYATGDVFAIIRPGLLESFVVFRGERLPSDARALSMQLPGIFKLKTDLRMPDSMSILELAGTPRRSLGLRRRRRELMSAMEGTEWTEHTQLGASLLTLWRGWVGEKITDAEARRREEFELGKNLLIDIARISPTSFRRLQAAIDEEREGEIEGLISAMNVAIDEHLNFKRWWTQDTNFDIQVKAREQELALVIQDRTKSSYSFAERSQGLQYFLSYFVQLEAHKPFASADEVMLLDEPDAFLSSRGQQDLLRVLQEYSRPEAGGAERQVMYVTHSPFLIDRNAGQRIRVLDKGREDEGTRVVKDATQNHYEPLRTSLGVSTAESAFIGGRNLFVEGIADQVLLTGMVADLTRRGRPTLDLNEVKVVPGNGADTVPYLVFLARGRGGTLPPSVALFDGDQQGEGGARTLLALKSGKCHILPKEFVVTVGDWAVGKEELVVAAGIAVEEPEDLVPLPLAVSAANRVAQTFKDSEEAPPLQEKALAKRVQQTRSLWPALEEMYREIHGAKLDKVAFARELLSLTSSLDDSNSSDLRDNFSLLLRHLADLLDDAEVLERSRRGANRLERLVAGFRRDHLEGVTRRRARSFIREVEQVLDDSLEADHVRIELGAIIREHHLDETLSGPLANFKAFVDALQRLEWAARTSGVAAPDVSSRTS